jgi:hypothetical protein
MPLLGSTASGSRRVPAIPSITSATGGNGQASIAFSVSSNGFDADSYTVTAYSGDTEVASATGSSSPIVVTGLTNGVAHTFKIASNNSFGRSSRSNASSSVTPVAAYALSQNFTSSGTFTVPSGATKMALTGVGAGRTGDSGGSTGGRAGGSFSIREISVTPGDTYSVTIASSGGQTTFGSILTANQNVTYNTGTADSIITGANQGGGYVGNCGTGGTGASQAAANSNDAQIPSYSGGGGGGGGSGRCCYSAGGNGVPGNGGAPHGGRGGYGGTYCGGNSPAYGGENGADATGYGGGGGGGGGARDGYANYGAGGAGGQAQILVYVK